jgi:cysteine desulfurase
MYFDTASTTKIAPEVVEKMISCLEGNDCYANPSSVNHHLGQIAAAIVNSARKNVAYELNCEVNEVIFTSGATEANNLALRGIALAHAAKGRHLITSAIEHKSVLDTCRALESEGFQVTYLLPNSDGWIEPESVKNAIRPDTLLVSLMHINNETGVCQPISAIAELLNNAGVLFHVDASQSAGKYLIDLSVTPIDLLSFSSHKFYGPKGIGCLVVRNRRMMRLHPLMHGGGQEFSLRPGTLATHQIVGLSEGLSLAAAQRNTDFQHVTSLKHIFLAELKKSLNINLHGDQLNCSPYIVNFSIEKISNDALINQLSNELAISSGSACSSGTLDPSYVLRAMGVEGDALYGAVRVSFSCKHTLTDILYAVERIVDAVARMKKLDEIG